MIYEGSGKIKIYGCSIKKIQKNFLIYFEIGERVYIKNKAENGILESVIIKKVYRNTNLSNNGFNAAISYVDTLNRVWIEEELSTKESATDLAKIYWQRVINKNQEFIEKYCPLT